MLPAQPAALLFKETIIYATDRSYFHKIILNRILFITRIHLHIAGIEEKDGDADGRKI